MKVSSWLKRASRLVAASEGANAKRSEYDVAISYASEDREIADAISTRLQQDGFRCFYNPNRLHKLLGLELGAELRSIYSDPSLHVIALISNSYLSKKYPQIEYAASLRGGRERIIPVRINNAPLPKQLKGVAYASTPRDSAERVAVVISQRIADVRSVERETVRPTQAKSLRNLKNIVPLDNPRRPYQLEDVSFVDLGDKYLVDIWSDVPEFDDPRHFINRGLTSMSSENVFSHITIEDVFEAKRVARELVERKKQTGWNIFNGKKFGISNVMRTRTPEMEHHQLVFTVYETDYFTHLFARKLYTILRARRDVSIDPASSFTEFSGLLTSFGLDILLFVPKDGSPHVVLTKRSNNVANQVGAGLWHVSMNEGLSLSDRFAASFDANATFYRGFDEELNLSRKSISHAELFEPFIEYNNFELGIAGAAYSTLDFEKVVETAVAAGDYLLENGGLKSIPATIESLERIISDEDFNTTNILDFCLRSARIREIAAR